MEGAYYVEPNGISGGLALWWQKEVQVRVMQAGTHVIDTLIQMDAHNMGVWSPKMRRETQSMG